jgi:hypothetical protein
MIRTGDKNGSNLDKTCCTSSKPWHLEDRLTDARIETFSELIGIIDLAF